MLHHLYLSRLDEHLTNGRIWNRLKNDMHTFTCVVSKLDKEQERLLRFFSKTAEERGLIIHS